MQRLSWGGLAATALPQLGLAQWMLPGTSGERILLAEAAPQIRHGILQFPSATEGAASFPLRWLLQVQRNVFFQNGFRANAHDDLEITSILLNRAAGDEPATYSSLQIQLGEQRTQLLLDERHWSVPVARTEAQLETAPGLPDLWVVQPEAGTVWQGEWPVASELFVQVLRGRIRCEDQWLTPDTALVLKGRRRLRVKASMASRLLVLGRS
mgnify:FL=1